ncbi:MAG: porin family protein [Endomicrobium sp.]|jgi:hypothetical protein|nr:porin family protein [Endomicrobium sp.]
MKKIFLSLVLAVFVSVGATASNGEINAKIGWDGRGKTKDLYKQGEEGKSGSGYSISAEYLTHIPKLDFLKFGAGLQYLFPRKLDTNYDEKLSFLPVYVTAQINPYRGFFIKGNLGKNIYCGVDERFLDDVSSGLYYAIGLGYEFSFGLIVEITHNKYECTGVFGKSVPSSYGYHGRLYCSKNILSLGYKFKI